MDSATLPRAEEFRIVEMRPLRGPNQWTGAPALECYLDLGAWNDVSSEMIPGFNERLAAWLPGLVEHRCSPGVRGGFLQRLARGTYFAHITEHVAIELQGMAGIDVSYGRTRATRMDRVYRIVIKQKDENAAMQAVVEARALALAAALDEPFDVCAAVDRIREIARKSMLPEETRILIQAAERRGIPYLRLGDSNIVQFGHGVHARRMLGLVTDRTGAITASHADEPELLERQLEVLGVPARLTQAGIDSPGSVRVRLLMVGGTVRAALDSAGRDVTGAVHPQIAQRASEAVRALAWDVAEVTVQAADLAKPLEEQEGAVVRIEPSAGLAAYLAPAAGDPRPVDDAILDLLHPPGCDGRIPIVAVTGTNGKTTVARLIAHILQAASEGVAMTCTEGVYLDGRRITRGDCSGPRSARQVLMHPAARTAVLETARGGIVRAGLGFDRCTVAVVTNIGSGDHLGIHEIETVDDLVRVKGTVVRAVAPNGAAVLNASDPAVAGMAGQCGGRVIFFAADPANEVVARHLEAGGQAVYLRDDVVTIAAANRERPVVPVRSIPLTLGGRVAFQVENVLAAAGAAWALGVPIETIAFRAARFAANLDSDPARFNVFRFRGARVIVDFGHNPDALRAVVRALDAFPESRRTAVFSSSGDRRDQDILSMGALLGEAFDRVILYEDNDLYDRRPGEVFRLLREGVARSGRTRQVEEIRGGVKAMQRAFETLQPGELLLAQAHLADPAVEYLRGLSEPLEPLS